MASLSLGTVYDKTDSLRLRRASDAGAFVELFAIVPAGGTSAANC